LLVELVEQDQLTQVAVVELDLVVVELAVMVVLVMQ
jgi:hypothetical protein